ncbi:bacteriohemerythrin [Serpentinicella sp. ANB-PHB4]|uniref:bacteriohemerythrin n=1 Tax=Serpentinicella sp. ANB-PHB4 TaxID=3074076 RepID=UPI00285A747E|nr:bacteriohemerythrin [Serpentinicella sp. ANB-PHB4]MDR5659608.1 bacteriohemerythrin [Serpentinicella sp. ANB-PHB4]
MFNWRDEFSCKISNFDNQHKKLFELGDHLHDLVSSQSDQDNYDEIMDTLYELKEYTVYHFKAEEALMEKHRYPKLLSHKIEHDLFIDEVNKLFKKDVDDDQVKVSMDILQFIANWIENHILKSDSLYGEFLNKQGVY